VRAGGLVFLSYNVMPGSAQMGVLQRALLEASRLSVGRSDARLPDAIARVEALRAAGAPHLSGEGLLAELFGAIREADPAYLVHEYMNESWSALYHADVARDMMTARLDYGGSAVPHESFPDLMLTPAQREALGEIAVPSARETLRDMFLNRILRKDLYMRGLQRMTEGEREAALAGLTLCCAMKPAESPLKLRAPAGEIELPAMYRDAAELLWREGPRRLGDLLEGPMAGSKVSAVQAAALLVSAGLAWPCLPPPDPRTSAAVVRAVVHGAERIRAEGLAARAAVPMPRIGSELPVPGLECLVLDGLWAGVAPDDTDAMVDHVWAPFEARGEWLVHKDERIEDPVRCRAILRDMLDRMRPDRLPFWRGLGMAPEPGAPRDGAEGRAPSP
jgi:hypothetical protein